MKLSDEDRRGLAIILGLLVLAGAARWVERPRPVLDDLQGLDVAALEAASREARPEPVQALRAGERIDPNTASLHELQRLPGVGAATAQRIAEERDRAAFRSVADLQRVRGIGPALTDRLAPHLALPAMAPPAPSAWATGPPPAVSSSVAGGSASTSSRTGTGGAAGGRLDLNRASADELQGIRGIGPALAARFVAHRDSVGGFRTWEEVNAVRGVGPALLARLREQAALSGQAP